MGLRQRIRIRIRTRPHQCRSATNDRAMQNLEIKGKEAARIGPHPKGIG
jgi:hypothetical protein